MSKFNELVNKILKEANVAGGTGSVFAYGKTPANIGQYGGKVGNKDFYGPGDARMPKVITPMMRRTFPETILKKKKKKKKKSKR